MQTLYFDCAMGVTGEMLVSSLLDCFDDSRGILDELNALDIPYIRYGAKTLVKAGIHGTMIEIGVEASECAKVLDLNGIHQLIMNLPLEQELKELIANVENMIADAQSRVARCDPYELEFNKAGVLYTIGETAAVGYMIDLLSPVHIFSSAVATGYGVQGNLPVPAPVTACILDDVPVKSGKLEGEMTSFTGAAILKSVAEDYGPMPIMKVQKIGYGLRDVDGRMYTCLRAVFGDLLDQEDTIYIHMNVDDFTSKDLGFTVEQLKDLGCEEIIYNSVKESLTIKTSTQFFKAVACTLFENEKVETIRVKSYSYVNHKKKVMNLSRDDDLCADLLYATMKKDIKTINF
jgi:uncharacterized protein (DUF111 family)